MKALVLENYMSVQYREVPVPEISEEEVLVKVSAAGICGSDVHGMDGSTGRRIPPIIMGHEASGVIEKKGKKVSGWQAGDRVTFDSTIYDPSDWFSQQGMYNISDGRMVLGVSTPEFKKNGAFAEYVAIPQHILHRLPDNVSFTEAALVEPAAVALHAINLSEWKNNAVVLVMGTGMIGLLLIQLLKIKGSKNLVAIDLEEDRLQLALKSGADHAFKPSDPLLVKTILSLTNGRGVDVVIEAVGITATINQSIDLLRKGGQLTIVGNLSPQVQIPLQKIVTGQLRIQGSCAVSGEYPDILDLIAQRKLNVQSILSVEAPLAEGPAWFGRLYQKEKNLMKVILKP